MCNVQYIGQPLLFLDFTNSPHGKDLCGSFIKIRPADFLLDYLVIMY